jgi:hypothetical protein
MPTMYTHGTALQVEDPGQLIRFGKLGWGAEAEFLPPQPDPKFPDTSDKFGPGSWFHLPLTSEPVADGIGRTVLTRVLTVAAVGGVYRQDSIFTIFFTNVAQLFTGGPRLGG